MNITLEQYGIDRLSSEDRLALIDLIWDSLPPDAPYTPPDANPDAGTPWEEVYARLTKPK